MKIGSTCASFHVKHLKCMGRIILKCISCEIISNLAIIPTCSIRKYSCCLEYCFQCSAGFHRVITCLAILPAYNACIEVDLTGMCIMYTSNIKNQHTINIDPHVIVAVEFIDHILLGWTIGKCCFSILWLQEISSHIHAEIIIVCSLSQIKFSAFFRISIS